MTHSVSNHSAVHFYSNSKAQFFGMIAIHRTYKGVSLGGCRIKEYSSYDSALKEVLRLSQHMTYKALLFDLKVGGAKSIIVKKKNTQKTPELLTAYAHAVSSLGGQYIASVDMGSSLEDMTFIRKKIRHVIGFEDEKGGAGDPGPYTALGVLSGIKTAMQHLGESLKGKKACLVGVGGVGLPLCQMLLKEGVDLTVADTNLKQVQEIKNYNSSVQAVDSHKALSVDCDILLPCAGGDVFSTENVKDLKCRVIAGAANNQLCSESVGQKLFDRNILYLPDFSVNSGGVIAMVLRGLEKKSEEETKKAVEQKVSDLTQEIIDTARKKEKPENELALEMAKQKFKTVYG